jgi:riboflavin synthase
MFTGIIETTGTIASVERRGPLLAVRVAGAPELPIGGSIALNGCCVTAVEVVPQGFLTELTEETLRRTSFAERLQPGVRVNLERGMRSDGRFDGHIVQGHVDGIGRIRDLRRKRDSAEIAIGVPEALERYLVEKGSVAVDGISLTVAGTAAGAFTVALIPYTLEHTTMRDARVGDCVNIEVDVIAKHVERLLATRRP